MNYNRNFEYVSLTDGENLDVSKEVLESLNEKSWVAIISEYDSSKSKVIVFNNEKAPENFCYSDFKDFGELIIGEHKKYDTSYLSHDEHLHQYSGIRFNHNGLECQVIDIYDGGITLDTIQKFVNANHSGMQNVISDAIDSKEYDKELEIARRIRP